jgi:predicted nucleic acid-binding protein
MLLDTDILIDLLRGNKGARDFLFSLPEDSPHCCSAITVAEIHSGMREGERQKTNDLIDSIVILPVTREIAEMAGKFRREHKEAKESPGAKRHSKTLTNPEVQGQLRGIELELDDCLIAATAATEGLELATRNIRHYPMPEVRIKPATY